LKAHHVVMSTAPPFPGLHASPPQRLSFAPGMVARSFLLERDHGNLLVYSTETASALAAVGRVSWQYLNHWHEAMFRPADAFDAPVVVHEDDAAETASRIGHAPVTFTGRHRLGEGFEIIPTPGHTPGATAYLWERGDHRFLFTGDTIYLSGDEWVAGVLSSSDRDAITHSIESIRDIDFDVLVPWAATEGHEPWTITDRADTRRRIDRLLVAAGLEHGAARVVREPA
jgi:glyoxylase-like metal-dependent hydrolase (beta-lactamase superfamily II)